MDDLLIVTPRPVGLRIERCPDRDEDLALGFVPDIRAIGLIGIQLSRLNRQREKDQKRKEISHPSSLSDRLAARNAFCGRVLEMDLLARMDLAADRMRRMRGFREPGQDQLQLMGVCCHIANGEDAGDIGL